MPKINTGELRQSISKTDDRFGNSNQNNWMEERDSTMPGLHVQQEKEKLLNENEN